jgi:predicted secreted protein
MNLIKKIILFFVIWWVFLVSNRKLSVIKESEEGGVRKKYVAATSFAIIVSLLYMLVRPKVSRSSVLGFTGRCPVCDNALLNRGTYCGECGSRV